MYQVQPIFPLPIYCSSVQVTDEQLNIIKSQGKRTNAYGNYISEDAYILNRPDMQSLKQQCQTHFDTFAKDILQVKDCSLRITQSWCNYNGNGSSHHTHLHTNSIVSAVFYVTDSPSSIIFFKDVSPNTMTPNTFDRNMFNAETYEVSPKKFSILLFPSYLEHGVKLNNTSEERISVAINSFYTGKLGDFYSLTQLEL